MAKNKKKPLDDNSLEAFLLSQQERQSKERQEDLESTKKSFENQKEIIKGVKTIFTPVNKTQITLFTYSKNQLTANKNLKLSIDKNTESLKQNLSNTKTLYNFLEKIFKQDKSKNNQTNKSKNKKSNENFEDKAKHEESILGTEDLVTPVLKSIKTDTEKLVELMEQLIKNKEDAKKEDSTSWFDKLPPPGKILPFVLPFAAAIKYPEVSNAVKAGMGAATAGARALAPVVEAAKAGASTASGLGKVGAAASAAKAAMSLSTFKTGMTGPAPLGTMGKVGVGLGAGATVGRILEGDTTGATAQGISTLLPLLFSKTKYGKLAGLASAGIDVGLLGRDYIKYQDKKEEAELRGETIKSPLQNFKDDVSKVGAFFGLGSSNDKEEENLDPVVENTAETNKILAEIRDKKMFANPEHTSSSMMAPAMLAGAGAGALLLRGGMGARLGTGVATTGIGQRILGGATAAAATARSTAGALGNTALSGAKAGVLGAGKMAGKLIPGVGLVMGAYGAYDKIKQGDMTGAAIEGASGIAALIPGIGTAVAIGLQGISATRDVIKASNTETTNSIKATNTETVTSIKTSTDEVNKSLITSTTDNNTMLSDSNASLSAAILANSELTNKNITDSSKNANNSLSQSASTLTNTTNTLASSLTSASDSLLGMIAKFTVPGVITQIPGFIDKATDKVKGWLNNPPEANPLAAPSSTMHSTRKDNMMGVYSAFLKAGMSEAQAKAMTAEIGRENEYGNDLWKTHKDHKNGKMNVGMMSWQNGRDIQLMNYLRKKGVVNKDGSIQRTQAALDAQAEYAVHELKTSHKSVGNKFLTNKNISYQDASKMLGIEFFKWRYDDPEYANGHARRDKNYATLNSEIHKRGIKSQDKKITYISQKEMDKLSKAEAKPHMMESQKAHESWKKREDERVKKLSNVQKSILQGTTVVGTAPKEELKPNIPAVHNTNLAKDEGSQQQSKISNQEYYNIGLKNVVVGNGVDMAGLVPACREAFYTMIGELYSTKKPKGKAVVSSAFRSSQKQQALWQDALRKYKTEEKARKWVAPPGRSKHEKGLALDVDRTTVGLLEKSGILGKYGFVRPLSNEPWHIEYKSGAVGGITSPSDTKTSPIAGTTSELGTAISEAVETPDFENLAKVGDAAISFAAHGLSTMLSGDAMNSIREFIKGGKIDAPKDTNPIPTAFGPFTQDESDPTRTMPKDSGNGDFWDNLDQQLGNGKLQRQERDQVEYNKVKKAWQGKQGIFRQIGGKHGWLSEMFSGLFGEDNLLSNVFGVLTGSQDIAGLPKLFDKAILGKNANLDKIGVMGGGFGGGLAENNEEAYPLIADHNKNTSKENLTTSEKTLEQMGAVGGGFGGNLKNTTVTNSNEENKITGTISKPKEIETYHHMNGAKTVYNEDGSYVYTRADGRISYINADNTISKIEYGEPPIPNINDSEISYSSPESSISISPEQMGAVGGGFGGNLKNTTVTNSNEENKITGTISKPKEIETYHHMNGAKTVYNEDGSYVYTRADGRISYINADNTISKIEYGEPPIPNINDSEISYSSPESSISISPEQMGAVGGGFGGAIKYDDTINRYENQEFEVAKYNQQQMDEQRRKVEVSIPQPTQTPTAQAPGGGKSSRTGLTGGTTFTRNPDSIIQQVAIAMMRSSL